MVEPVVCVFERIGGALAETAYIRARMRGGYASGGGKERATRTNKRRTVRDYSGKGCTGGDGGQSSAPAHPDV